jgi:hypothetical protein
MKNFFIALMLCVVSILGLVSCDNTLNKTIDEPLSFKEIVNVDDSVFSHIYDIYRKRFDTLPTSRKVKYHDITYREILDYEKKEDELYNDSILKKSFESDWRNEYYDVIHKGDSLIEYWWNRDDCFIVNYKGKRCVKDKMIWYDTDMPFNVEYYFKSIEKAQDDYWSDSIRHGKEYADKSLEWKTALYKGFIYEEYDKNFVTFETYYYRKIDSIMEEFNSKVNNFNVDYYKTIEVHMK